MTNDKAWRRQRARRLGEAAAIYRQILQTERRKTKSCPQRLGWRLPLNQRRLSMSKSMTKIKRS